MVEYKLRRTSPQSRAAFPQPLTDVDLDVDVCVVLAVAKFRWTRDRLYDRLCCALLFESCFEAGQCTIADIQNKQTIKRSAKQDEMQAVGRRAWRP